jgi:hypothetical protein
MTTSGRFSYKTLIGPSLRSRTFDRQKVEAAVAVRCINRFTALGMPTSRGGSGNLDRGAEW